MLRSRDARGVLEAIAILERGDEPVTNARLAAMLSLVRQNVRLHLFALAGHGLIEYDAAERKTAIVRLTARGRRETGVLGPGEEADTPEVPVVAPILAGEQLDVQYWTAGVTTVSQPAWKQVIRNDTGCTNQSEK